VRASRALSVIHGDKQSVDYNIRSTCLLASKLLVLVEPVLNYSCAVLGLSWAVLDCLGPTWDPTWAVVDHLRYFSASCWGLPGAILGSSWVLQWCLLGAICDSASAAGYELTVIVQTYVECWSELTATKYIPGQTQMPRGIWRSQEEKPAETGRSEKEPGGAIGGAKRIQDERADLGHLGPGPSHLVAILCLPFRPSWSQPGAILGLGAILEPAWASLEPSCGYLGAILEPAWGHLGASLGPSWAVLGPSWAILGHLGASWSHLGPFEPSWSHLGAFLEPSWGILEPSWGHLGASLEPSWTILGPSWAPGAIVGQLGPA
jgi:hypothetical protein